MISTCPICGTAAVASHPNPNRPFCSERCRWLDLGRWLDGDYVIPGESVDPEHLPVTQRPNAAPGPEDA